MNVLLTGAFGNVGTSTLRELVRQGHAVRCFDLKTRANQQAARQYGGQIEVVWGDIRRADEVAAAASNRDVVIHTVAIIPPLSEARPDWAQDINVGGTRNVIAALRAQPHPPRLIYTSSYALFGHKQHLPPPRTVADPIEPTDHYTRHKAECERLIRESGLTWAILRLAAVVPVAMAGKDLRMTFRQMFDVPLNQRIEIVHTADVGLALANAVGSEAVWGKVLLIGGGPNCRLYQKDFYRATLEAFGVGMLPEEAYGSEPFHTDWIDTTESQRLLQYQRHSFDDYVREVTRSTGTRRHLARLFRPVVRYWILQQSPYYRNNAKGRRGP